MLLAILYSESAYLISPGQPLKPRFYEIFIICLLFSHTQQKLIICCCKYNIRNQRTRLPYIAENMSLR